MLKSTPRARSRSLYGLACVIIIECGLASRRYAAVLPPLISAYAGDTLWALMVFAGLGMIFTTASPRGIALGALSIAYVDELSQLYHAPWIDALRHTRLSGLILGFSFVWSDLACYAVGVFIGVAAELCVMALRRPSGVQ
jgi:hypothetical protein